MSKRLLFLPILFIISAACQFVSQLPEILPNSAADQPGQPANTQPIVMPDLGTGIFGEPANPVNLELTLDSAAVTQVIPSSGGTLSAVGSDGALYTLTIPPGALLVDTEISLTPISAIANLPFSGGLGGAVQMEPSGLAFDQFVTLTIQPVNPIALENQVLFGFEASGADLHMALPSANQSVIEIQLLHFSGAGVASGVSDEKAAVYKRLADRVEARLTNETGKYLQDLRQGANPDPGVLEGLMQEYYNSVVIPRLKAATAPGATCGDAQIAMRTYLGWERQRQLLGVGIDDNKMELVMANYFPAMAKKCMDEEFERCTVKHEIAGMLPMILGFERQGQLLGAFSGAEPAKDDPNWVEIREYGLNLMRKCFQFDLVFESAGTFTYGADGYSSSVNAKVPIRPQGDLAALIVELKGASALTNENFTFNDTMDDCDVENFRGGGTFEVYGLGWETVIRKDEKGEPRLYVKDFILSYYPGSTSESFTLVNCWDTLSDPDVRLPDVPVPSAPYWTALFITTHYKEVASPTGSVPAVGDLDTLMAGAGEAQTYIAKTWRVSTSEVLGTKDWSGSSELDSGVFEGGEFQLLHKPQR